MTNMNCCGKPQPPQQLDQAQKQACKPPNKSQSEWNNRPVEIHSPPKFETRLQDDQTVLHVGIHKPPIFNSLHLKLPTRSNNSAVTSGERKISIVDDSTESKIKFREKHKKPLRNIINRNSFSTEV